MNNYAFIDSQNVYLSIKSLGWKVDWKRFRVYLKEHYQVSKAFVFIGYVGWNNRVYEELQVAEFICIFKPTLEYKDGTIKGNVDTELVLHAMIEYPNFDQAIVISGDGDFYCLIQYLINKDKLKAVMVPNRFRYSALLKFKEFKKFLRFMNDLQEKIKKAS